MGLAIRGSGPIRLSRRNIPPGELKHHALACKPLLNCTFSLYVKPEVHDITIMDDIFFAFHRHLARFLHSMFRPEFQVIVVFDDFGTDEAAFKIGMNNAGCLGCFGALTDGPGSYFFSPAVK